MTRKKYKIVQRDTKETQNKVKVCLLGREWIRTTGRQAVSIHFCSTESRRTVGTPPPGERGRNWGGEIQFPS